MLDTDMLIGSNFVAGTDSPEPVVNPKTEDLIVNLAGSFALAGRCGGERGRQGLQELVTHHARRAVGLILKLADAIEKESESFATLEALNCGKPRIRVLQDEMPAVVDCFRYFAGAVRNMHGAVAGEYLAGHTSMIRRDPIGVVASIAPWNYPLMMAAWKIAPAIAAGNTVVLKPSEQTPLTALKLARIIADVLPEGVVNVVVGRGGSVGQALIDHPLVSMISLTGDIATGRKVLSAATASIKRTHLELGGKAPVVVFDDADIDAVVEGVKVFGYYNAGQDCTAACRIYADKKIYDKLVADLSSAVSSLKYALPNDDDNEIGPLISNRQRARVASFVERAKESKHISIATGGKLAAGKASSTSRPSLPAPCRPTRSCNAKCSARWYPSLRFRTWMKRSLGPMIPNTAWRHRSGHATSAKPWRRPLSCSTAAPGSIAISCWSTRCRTEASSSRAMARTSACMRSKTTPRCVMLW